jgi:hypothetical protein
MNGSLSIRRRLAYASFRVAGRWFLFFCCLSVLFGSGCGKKEEIKKDPLFEVLDANKTGIQFSNTLHPDSVLNLFQYLYYYNGAGVAAGDFNNDGKIDLFFAANQEKNALYLNEGNLKFRDVTDSSHLPQDGGWSTGVTVADVNGDGLLDIYICKVGDYLNLHSHNQLLICTGIDKNGIPHYEDKAKEYGLDFSGFSTQAVFFDYDMDGDLDMFLLNHSIHQNGTFRPRNEMDSVFSPLAGERLFRNDGGKFTDVSKSAGINTTPLPYGLGVVVADINLDGLPDIYVGNDFHENDYLYINQGNGTFKESLGKHIMHTSEFSMGVDAADVNNDGYPEIVSMDMMPYDPYTLKRSLGEDPIDIFNMKIKFGYNYQYSRNNLQLNRKNGMFSEIGAYSGIYATDWSWSALWMDFDNDGNKDLFISNGIPKRMNDIDYINYVSNEEMQKKIQENKMGQADMALIDKFPQIKIPNKFYRNSGNMIFDDMEDRIINNEPNYSNGAVYADFDGDGRLDIAVNNINDKAVIYHNVSDSAKNNFYINVKLVGDGMNRNAVGSKIFIYSGKQIITYEKFPVHGFMSSMETPVHIGLKHDKIDSAILIWPDNTYEHFSMPASGNDIVLNYKKGLPKFNYANFHQQQEKLETRKMEDISKKSGLQFVHKEDFFNEFDREPLIPHMLSTEGPALAVADINGDGLEDVFFGSSKWEKSAVFLQLPGGKFKKIHEPVLDNDSTYEDVSACWTDINNDGSPDLLVASGGNAFFGQSPYMLPRAYLNDGKGNLTKVENAFPGIYVNQSCIATCDFNGDGYADIFIGGRDVPYAYGVVPHSYLLINDKTGHFKDVTASVAKELSNIGFVTNAVWYDIDNDGDQDLILSLEWGGIVAFINNKGTFTKKVLSDKKGWWNFVLPVDINNDGKVDLIVGNMGLNSRLKASEKEPVRLYYADFDDNGKKDQVLTYYLSGREIPLLSKIVLEKQIPMIKKNFLYAGDFAKASLKEIFSPGKLDSAEVLTVNYFSNAVLINKGNLEFETKPLPWMAQLTSYRDAVVVNANNDSLPDILLVGNYYENNIELGRYDADFGTLLINKGNSEFDVQSINGLQIIGQSRHIRKINIGPGKDKNEAYIIARNNDSSLLIRFTK